MVLWWLFLLAMLLAVDIQEMDSLKNVDDRNSLDLRNSFWNQLDLTVLLKLEKTLCMIGLIRSRQNRGSTKDAEKTPPRISASLGPLEEGTLPD
jgi:hypothetical protein